MLVPENRECHGIMTISINSDQAWALWCAYRNTVYIAVLDERELHIRIDRATTDLDTALVRRGVATWAFITAWNPLSQMLSRAENDARHAKLIEEASAWHFETGVGRGEPADGAWVPEASVLVLGINQSEALALGRRYGQLAIVVGRHGEPAKLIECGVDQWRGGE